MLGNYDVILCGSSSEISCCFSKSSFYSLLLSWNYWLLPHLRVCFTLQFPREARICIFCPLLLSFSLKLHMWLHGRNVKLWNCRPNYVTDCIVCIFLSHPQNVSTLCSDSRHPSTHLAVIFLPTPPSNPHHHDATQAPEQSTFLEDTSSLERQPYWLLRLHTCTCFRVKAFGYARMSMRWRMGGSSGAFTAALLAGCVVCRHLRVFQGFPTCKDMLMLEFKLDLITD